MAKPHVGKATAISDLKIGRYPPQPTFVKRRRIRVPEACLRLSSARSVGVWFGKGRVFPMSDRERFIVAALALNERFVAGVEPMSSDVETLLAMFCGVMRMHTGRTINLHMWLVRDVRRAAQTENLSDFRVSEQSPAWKKEIDSFVRGYRSIPPRLRRQIKQSRGHRKKVSLAPDAPRMAQSDVPAKQESEE